MTAQIQNPMPDGGLPDGVGNGTGGAGGPRGDRGHRVSEDGLRRKKLLSFGPR